MKRTLNYFSALSRSLSPPLLPPPSLLSLPLSLSLIHSLTETRTQHVQYDPPLMETLLHKIGLLTSSAVLAFTSTALVHFSLRETHVRVLRFVVQFRQQSRASPDPRLTGLSVVCHPPLSSPPPDRIRRLCILQELMAVGVAAGSGQRGCWPRMPSNPSPLFPSWCRCSCSRSDHAAHMQSKNLHFHVHLCVCLYQVVCVCACACIHVRVCIHICAYTLTHAHTTFFFREGC